MYNKKCSKHWHLHLIYMKPPYVKTSQADDLGIKVQMVFNDIYRRRCTVAGWKSIPICDIPISLWFSPFSHLQSAFCQELCDCRPMENHRSLNNSDHQGLKLTPPISLSVGKNLTEVILPASPTVSIYTQSCSCYKASVMFALMCSPPNSIF